jgi:hypothetical protein
MDLLAAKDWTEDDFVDQYRYWLERRESTLGELQKDFDAYDREDGFTSRWLDQLREYARLRWPRAHNKLIDRASRSARYNEGAYPTED